MAVRNDFRLSGAADAAGVLELRWTTQADRMWEVQQVSVEMPTAPPGCTCALRKDGYLITPIIPTGSTAAGEPFLRQRPGEVVTVTWDGATPGDTGRVWVAYEVLPWGEG